MKASEQYATAVTWIGSCNGTSSMFFPGKLKRRTLKLFYENGLQLTIRIIKEGFFISR